MEQFGSSLFLKTSRISVVPGDKNNLKTAQNCKQNVFTQWQRLIYLLKNYLVGRKNVTSCTEYNFTWVPTLLGAVSFFFYESDDVMWWKDQCFIYIFLTIAAYLGLTVC